ncbi:alginate lyase family protein [Mucilaginibacter sp. AW1-3]
MKKSFIATLVFLLSVLFVNAQYVGLNNAEIAKLKQLIDQDADVKAYYKNQEAIADASLNVNPNPIDTILSEGKLEGDPKKTATAFALKDMSKIYSSALVYKLYNDKEYLKNAVQYLLAWAKLNKSKGDPIDDTNLDGAIEAYDMLKANINAANNEVIVAWFKQVAAAEVGTWKPNKATGYNNWNSHRLKVVGEIAYAINDADLQKFTIDGLKKQIEVNLYADGSGVDFKLRDALHYHAYDLEPLLKLAIVLKRATGVDYYSYVSDKQSSIKKSVEWFVPYVSGEKTHGEFVNSTVSFDKKRAMNGQAEYKAGTLFKPTNGLKTLGLACYFDPQYITVIKKVKSTDKTYPDWQAVLNKVML